MVEMPITSDRKRSDILLYSVQTAVVSFNIQFSVKSALSHYFLLKKKYSQTHVVAKPVKTPEHEVEAVAETPAEESLVMPAEKEAAAETISSVKPPTGTPAVDVEPVVEASMDINKPVVEVVEEPAVELEVTRVDAEPVNIHTVTEVKEVTDSLDYLH